MKLDKAVSVGTTRPRSSSRPLGVMDHGSVALSLVLTLSLASANACAGGNQANAIQSSADSDSERVWIALLKGFEGDVLYVGSDDAYSYFQLGTFFKSYHKLPRCAAKVPETFPLQTGRRYTVRFHIQADNTIRMEGSCPGYQGHVLGELDRVQ